MGHIPDSNQQEASERHPRRQGVLLNSAPLNPAPGQCRCKKQKPPPPPPPKSSRRCEAKTLLMKAPPNRFRFLHPAKRRCPRTWANKETFIPMGRTDFGWPLGLMAVGARF